MGIPSANRLKGWPETHHWSWKFAGGHPVAMTVTIEGGRLLEQGRAHLRRRLRALPARGDRPRRQARRLRRGARRGRQGADARPGRARGPRQGPAHPPPAREPHPLLALDRPPGAGRPAIQAGGRRRPDQAGRSLRVRRLGLRPAPVHHHRRRGHDVGELSGPVVPALLLGLPRRVPRQPGQIRPEGAPAVARRGQGRRHEARLRERRRGRRCLRRPGG